jgi:hypothetical protein
VSFRKAKVSSNEPDAAAAPAGPWVLEYCAVAVDVGGPGGRALWEDDAEEKFVAEGGLAGGGGPEDLRRGMRPCEEEEEEEKEEEEDAAAAEP